MPDGGNVNPAIESLERRFGAVLAVERLPKSAVLSRRYGAGDGRLFLVRPDGYVSFKSAAAETGLLEEHLGTLLRL
jgi:hypothetical protein